MNFIIAVLNVSLVDNTELYVHCLFDINKKKLTHFASTFFPGEETIGLNWLCFCRYKHTRKNCQVSALVQSIIYCFNQGIINPTGSETFAQEPGLAKLFRELKLTTVSYNKERRFFSHVCYGKFAVFLALCCRITCKWVLFSLCIIIYIITLVVCYTQGLRLNCHVYG